MDLLGLEHAKQKLQEAQREALVKMGNQAQNYFVSSFRKQGFGGVPWKEVQRREPDKAAYKYPKKKGLQRRTSPILVGAGYKTRGGDLRRAVGSMMKTSQMNGTTSLRMAIDNVPYAIYHNEGTEHIDKRPFVGQTPELTTMQEKTIKTIIDNLFKK